MESAFWVSCPGLFFPLDLVLEGSKRRSLVALSLRRSSRWCLKSCFLLWVTGFLVAVEKSDEGIYVAVAPRNPGSADVYFLRQRAHQTFFYSVARAGLCAAVWWRVIFGSGVCCVFVGVGALKS